MAITNVVCLPPSLANHPLQVGTSACPARQPGLHAAEAAGPLREEIGGLHVLLPLCKQSYTLLLQPTILHIETDQESCMGRCCSLVALRLLPVLLFGLGGLMHVFDLSAQQSSARHACTGAQSAPCGRNAHTLQCEQALPHRSQRLRRRPPCGAEGMRHLCLPQPSVQHRPRPMPATTHGLQR